MRKNTLVRAKNFTWIALILLGTGLTQCKSGSDSSDDLLLLAGFLGAGCVTFDSGFNGRLSGASTQCPGFGATQAVTAEPRSGFTFTQWSDGNTDNPRTVQSPVTDMTLTAQYSTTGLKTVWIGYSFIKRSLTYLDEIARVDAGYTDHEDRLTFDGGCNGAPGEIWDDPALRAAAQANIVALKPDAVVMGYFIDVSSEYQDYADWVDFTLTHSPRARFYIVLPWPISPGGKPATNPCFQPARAQDSYIDSANPQVLTEFIATLTPAFETNVLARLRSNYPDNDFIFVPQFELADAALQAKFAGSLSYGPSAAAIDILGSKPTINQSIFTDTTGHQGGILASGSAILYLRYVYGLPVSDLAFWQSKTLYTPDLTIDDKALPLTGLSNFNGVDLVSTVDAVFSRYEE